MKLPVVYADIPQNERWMIRQAYMKQQDGKCYHCGGPFTHQAPDFIMKKRINKRLFPSNFFDHPIHLHHSHETGLTIGAVHCHCNAVLWQYHGE